MDKATFDKLVSTIEDAGFEARSYSGRGMYGSQCLGVSCDSPISCVMQIVSSFCENADDVESVKDLVDTLSDPSTDAMGRGGIVYWTSIPWLDEEEDEGDDGGPSVEVSTEEYEDAHGRKPRGEGRWAFFLGERDLPVWFTGDYKACLASAKAAANDEGIGYLSVGT